MVISGIDIPKQGSVPARGDFSGFKCIVSCLIRMPQSTKLQRSRMKIGRLRLVGGWEVHRLPLFMQPLP